MHSIRSKTTLLAIIAIIVTTVVSTLIGVVAIRDLGRSNSEQLLLLMCETGEKNLDQYFGSIEQSVEMEASFIAADIDGLDEEHLAAHVERANKICDNAAYKTNGVLTYYYRIDPAVSTNVQGFWYTNLDGRGFTSHEVTDLSVYDTQDTSQIVWFTVPKSTGKPTWLPPYVTDNLDKRVLSYTYPIYYEGTFVGVVGIEIDYATMAEQVDNIQLYDHGYAFINDAEGNIIYHPNMDVAEIAENPPKVPDGLLSTDKFIEYEFDGVQKEAVWLPLSNGMRLNVTVPVSEINGNWEQLVLWVSLAAIVLLMVFVTLVMYWTGRFTRPLEQLAEAAEQVDNGNYDVSLHYKGDDEVGTLSRTFNRLTRHLKSHIDDLNSLAYADALTSLKNKHAFDMRVDELQQMMKDEEGFAFAIAIFDCDHLKDINDRFGHGKGNVYLTKASHLICQVFAHSPVFRIGGDEFAAIMTGSDYENRDALAEQFDKKCEDACRSGEKEWDKVSVSMGIAVYDPDDDYLASDVVRRADKAMYENKRRRGGRS